MDPSQTEDLGGAPSRDPQPEELLGVGGVFGDYDILEELGRGGMGAVYKARHRSLGRLVALKVLLPHRRESDGSGTRLLREARALAQLDHHNIVTVHHVGERAGLQFIEMQYVDGQPLTAQLDRGPLEAAEAGRIVEQVARALSHAHRKGVVHRDIKPGNILLTPDGVVKVADFGLARQVDVTLDATASTATVCGTPAYMAPEQWSGVCDARTDQYGLGVTYYQLVTGRPPFSGNPSSQMQQHLSAAPAPPHHLNARVPEAVSTIISRLMAKEPGNRYASCDELVTALRLLANPPAGGPAALPTRAPSSEMSTDHPPAVLKRTFPAKERARALGGAMAGAVLLLQALGALDGAERKSLDARFGWTRGEGGQSPVLLVVIDRASKERLAPDRPLSRERHYGELIARLGEARARAIGFDLLLTDRAAREEDGSLAVMTRMTPTVVHAINLNVDPALEAPPPERPVPQRWSLEVSPAGLPKAQRLDIPVPEIAEAAPRVGHLALSVDPDGVIRRIPHLLSYRGRVYPSLSLATVMTALGVARDGVAWSGGVLELRPAQGPPVRVPVDPRGQMLVNFRWRERKLVEAPLFGFLEAPARPGAGAAQVVLVGSKLDGDSDVGALPGRPLAALVHAHALAVDTILSESFVVPVGWMGTALGIVVAALCASLAAGFLRPLPGFALTAGGLAAYAGAALWAFSGHTRVALPLAGPALAAGLAFLAVTLSRYWSQEAERRALAGALSRYLSPAVTRRVLSDPEGLKIGGKRVELTVLCAEVHRFSEVSERLEPEEVDDFLGRFFASMTEAVFDHEGTLDQLTGQGLRVFFGDPQPQEDHALRAVRCALDMRGRAADVIRAWARDGRPTLQVGIGIHTGYVTVGNVGSVKRMVYTILGRNVDLAVHMARIEPGRILVSARTRALTEDGVAYAAHTEADGQVYHEALSPRGQ